MPALEVHTEGSSPSRAHEVEIETSPAGRPAFCGLFSCFRPRVSRRVDDSSSSSPTAPRAEEVTSTSSQKASSKQRPAPVDVLPRSDEATDDFKFFCPICMFFFAEMHKTSCCGHHLCGECYEQIKARQQTYTPQDDGEIQSVLCPHCNSHKMVRIKLASKEEGRRYEDSPAVKGKSGKSSPSTPRSTSGGVAPSPLKVGDSYESMMKKMLTYDQCGININNGNKGGESSGIQSLSSSKGAEGLPGVPFPPLPEDQSWQEDSDPLSRTQPLPMELVRSRPGDDGAVVHSAEPPRPTSVPSGHARPPMPLPLPPARNRRSDADQ